MKSGISLSEKNKDINEIWQWYRDQLNSIKEVRNKILNASLSDDEKNFDNLIALSPKEIEDYFSNHVKELELLVCFNIVAATEGKIREDFIRKIDNGRTSQPLVAHYKQLFGRRKKEMQRVSLEDDIFKVWIKEHPKINKQVDEFRKCLKFRHWLAHGRYYKGDFKTFIPLEIKDISKELFDKFPHIDNWD